MIERSAHSSNQVGDLGSGDPGEHQLKAWIALHIARRIESAELTQTLAAQRMGLTQPDLSAVLHGKFNGYSVERLARCLSALGDEVRLTVKAPDGSEDTFVLEAL